MQQGAKGLLHRVRSVYVAVLPKESFVGGHSRTLQ